MKGLYGRVYRLACRWAPLGLERRWRDRMAEDFEARLAEPKQGRVGRATRLLAGALVNLGWEIVARALRRVLVGARIGRTKREGGTMMEMLWRDVRHAVRGLVRAPGFATVVVVTLALAIGANTALFTVVDGVLLRPMPYGAPERLYQITVHFEDGVRDPYSSFADFSDLRRELSAAEELVAFHGTAPTFTAEGADPLRLRALAVSSGFFEALRLRPAIGSLLTRDDVLERNEEVVVIGYGLWERAFGRDPSVIGQAIELDGRSRTVIGVGPERFANTLPGLGRAEAYLPLSYEVAESSPNRGNHNLRTLVRLEDGATHEVAEQELDAVMARLRDEYPDSNVGKGADLEPFHDLVVADVRSALTMLLACVGVVLLIAVANVTSVLMGRASDRVPEMSLRTALGASRGRIVGQLVVESLLLAGLGGLVGIGLAVAGTERLVSWIGATLPPVGTISVNTTVLAATSGLTLGAGLLMGVIPAWLIGRTELARAIRAGAGNGTASRRRHRVRSGLVILQVGLCLTLLSGTGLLVRTLTELGRVDIGVDESVLSFGLHLPDARYPEWADHEAFHRALEERLERIPGVVEVGSINGLPLSTTGICGTLYAEEDPTRFEGGDTCAQVRSASADYFRIMGIDLLQGRLFGEGDDPEADLIVINRATADLLWPGENPLGRRVMTGFRGVLFEVIGVVENVKQFDLDEEPLYQTYLWEKRWRRAARSMVVAVGGDSERVLPSIREAVWSIDRRLPLYAVTTVDELRDARMAEHRLRTVLLTAMSFLALILAAVGIYGVVSYSVSQRQREMAIRISIGARTVEVRRMVLAQALRLVAGGSALGAMGAIAFGRSLEGFLYQVEQNDPATFVTVAAVLLATAALAAALPARRATRVDPMRVLREE